jgi:hypothetical protein
MSDADNPYLPPKAVVSDVTSEPRPTRPMAVTIALYLIGVRMLMGAAMLLSPMLGARGSYLLMGLMAVAFSAAITFTLGVSIARGRNWGRIVYLVLTLFSLVSLALSIASMFDLPAGVTLRSEPSIWSMVTLLVPSAMSIAVVVLLFGPGRAWFRARSE